MPMYEYECAACHRRTEKIQKFSDAELTVCPHCGGRLERTITAAAFSFGGGGWYKDGYASVKPPATGSAGDSGSTGSAASDTPAAAPAAAPAPATTAPAASASPSASKP